MEEPIDLFKDWTPEMLAYRPKDNGKTGKAVSEGTKRKISWIL